MKNADILLQKAFSSEVDSQKRIKENEQFKPITLNTVIKKVRNTRE